MYIYVEEEKNFASKLYDFFTSTYNDHNGESIKSGLTEDFIHSPNLVNPYHVVKFHKWNFWHCPLSF